jgi:alpha-L-fucosidase
MQPMERIEGKLKRLDGQLVIETRIGTNPEPIVVPIEEFLEEFEGKDVLLKADLRPDPSKAIYNDKNWEIGPEDKDHEYKKAPPESYERFLDMKFGMMVHFGIYNHLGVTESWSANRMHCDPEFIDVYYTLWEVFNPIEFNADEWADLAVRAGMQFFQITTKHHDGFSMYNTKTKTKFLKRTLNVHKGVGTVEEVEGAFSIMDTKFKRDIVGELITAFRKRGLGIGLYFSHIDWNDPNFRWDKANRSYTPDYGPNTHPEQWKAFIQREREQLRELMTNYGEIDQIFFDGSWFGLEPKEMLENIKMMRKLQPKIMLSNRGIGQYGDFTSPERWIPTNSTDPRTYGMLWQVCDPIHTSWAYLPSDVYKPIPTLLKNLVDAVAKGGTYVFAISPMPSGKFPPKTIETLQSMGDWLHKNAQAIYYTRPWKQPKLETGSKDMDIYFTRSKANDMLYVIVLGKIPQELVIPNIAPRKDARVICLPLNSIVEYEMNLGNLKLKLKEEQKKKLESELGISFAIPI